MKNEQPRNGRHIKLPDDLDTRLHLLIGKDNVENISDAVRYAIREGLPLIEAKHKQHNNGKSIKVKA